MPKKKAPSNKATEQNKNTKKIIAVQHREIKHSRRKHDSAFMEVRVWLPLWELPLWLFPESSNDSQEALLDALKKLLSEAFGGKTHE